VTKGASHLHAGKIKLSSVLQPSSIRELATPWTYFLHLSLSSVILIDSSTRSPVHVLMLSIQAVRDLPRLRAPGKYNEYMHVKQWYKIEQYDENIKWQLYNENAELQFCARIMNLQCNSKWG